jgi:transcriptional regulator GlxA family with amidase domain
VESVRFDLARALLDGGATVTRAAIESGFGSPETLRRVFLSRIGLPPSGYRQRFLTTGAAH